MLTWPFLSLSQTIVELIKKAFIFGLVKVSRKCFCKQTNLPFNITRKTRNFQRDVRKLSKCTNLQSLEKAWRDARPCSCSSRSCRTECFSNPQPFCEPFTWLRRRKSGVRRKIVRLERDFDEGCPEFGRSISLLSSILPRLYATKSNEKSQNEKI